MHKIKRQAHKAGWYAGNDGSWGSNFITGRAKTRYMNDEENQLRTIRTDNDRASPLEDRRRELDRTENAQFSGPQKSGTFPQALPKPAHGSSTDREADFTSSDKPDSNISSGETEKQPSTDPIDDPTIISTSNETRQRSGKKKWLHPFSKTEEDDISSQDDSDESKKKKRYPKLTLMSQLKTIFASWINILLIFVPVGIALEYSGVNKVIVFVINFVAIIPLAAMLSYATEELALYIGEVLGGLLNATFGNAVELIVGIIALTQGQVLIVQTSLIGSMLSNLLLVMGMCFFFGGINRVEQHFNLTVAQTAASLLALAIGSLIIPTAFRIFAQSNNNGDDKGINPLSRGTAVLLLVVYGCYLLFQLRTHVDIYNEPGQKVGKRSTGKKEAGDAVKGMAVIGAASGAATAGGHINRENLVQDAPDEEETPSLTRLTALVTLAVSTVFIALCAEYMVSAIGAVAQSVSQEFIGLILLPIVGNAAEHVTAVTVAIKDKMDLSIGVAIGSSLQIALLVLPIMVMLSWWGVGRNVDGMDTVLNLNFDGFLVVVLVVSIWLVNYVVGDGKSNYLEGVLLMITYLIIAVAAWFYPVTGDVV